MENLKIKVNSEAESKEAQELFFELGGAFGEKQETDRIGLVILANGKVYVDFDDFENHYTTEYGCKEITLPELRAMVNHDQNEPFLTPECTLNNQYAEIEQVRQDMINSPNHYADSEIECIDAMRAMMTHEQFTGYLRGNVFKYLWRYQKKNGAEDLKKSNWHLQKLIENTI